MTKQEAELEVIRRWYLLPDHLRESYEHADAYAGRLEHEIDFHTVTDKRRLIGAWLIREITQTSNLARQARAEKRAA